MTTTESAADRARNVVIVVVTDDDRSDAGISLAISRGVEGHATVVLYDVSAAPTFGSPLPTNWSSDDQDRRVPSALSVAGLEAAGQHGLAERVRALVDAGIDAYGWLPDDDKAATLATYADGMTATEVIVVEGVQPDAAALTDLGVSRVTVAA